ncbi:MAG: hypothetical protein DMG88_22975 [Acidobacteria bacterium]|nr:MAG: hypothetical protein DMG88_22975 [Acidobacteriota bacterium]
MAILAAGEESVPTWPFLLQPKADDPANQKPRWSGGAWQLPVWYATYQEHYSSGKQISSGRAEDDGVEP